MTTKTFNCTLTFELEGETEEQVRRELQDMIDAAAYDATFFTVVRCKAKTPLSSLAKEEPLASRKGDRDNNQQQPTAVDQLAKASLT